MYNDDLNHYINLQYNAKDNDDFKNAKIFKIYMSNFRSKSKSRVNWAYDKFYMMIRSCYINCKIEFIENCPCNNAEE